MKKKTVTKRKTDNTLKSNVNKNIRTLLKNSADNNINKLNKTGDNQNNKTNETTQINDIPTITTQIPDKDSPKNEPVRRSSRLALKARINYKV